MRVLTSSLALCLSVYAQKQSSLRQLSEQVADLSARIRSSVVQVVSNGYAPEQGVAAVRQSSGSGFIISADGLIVTNAHVVTGSSRLRVYLPAAPNEGGSIVKPRGPLRNAKVLGVDSETDLALLKVEASSLPALKFADSDRIRQGEMVLAVGHPLGLEEAVGFGVISAVARQLKPDDPLIYVQTDASINPGNSGGPLVNMEGEVVGVNTLILSQSGGNEGVGFAIPSNIVRAITEQLRERGKVRRGFIGVSAQSITPGLAAGLGLDRERGVILSDVIPGGPADAAGLQAGDIVLSLNGKSMENARQFQVNIYRQAPLSDASINVWREASERLIKVQVSELPGDPDLLSKIVDEKVSNIPRLGILAVTLDDQIKELVGDLRRDHGILVASRAVSATEAAGLQAGDAIYSFDREPVSSVEQFRKLLDAKEPGDIVVLQIERSGVLRYVELVLD